MLNVLKLISSQSQNAKLASSQKGHGAKFSGVGAVKFGFLVRFYVSMLVRGHSGDRVIIFSFLTVKFGFLVRFYV